MRFEFAAAVLALAAPALASDLMGPESCRTCHAEAYRIWSQGPHARAVASFTAEQRRSALCMSCHSRDEQRSNAADPIAGVSCETCHGAGRFYEPAVVMRDKELARLFGMQDAADLLEETLEEEKKTDKLLSELAEARVNQKAA